MALQIWLPLTKDTRNQGLANGEINWTTTASFTNNGKLGKALATGGCKMPASMTSQVLNNTAVSIACWLYVNADADDSTNRAMIFGNDSMSTLGGRQFSIFRYPNADDIHLSWQNYNNGTYSGAVVGGVWSGVLTPHAWNHICVTYQNPKVIVYVNGIQIGTTSGVINTDSFAYDTQVIYSSTSHYINDFRIYDHCLSPMEIKELSRGLVLHYLLNRGGWGQENLLPNTNEGTTGWNWTMQVGDYTKIEETTLSGVRGCKFTRGTTTQSGWSVIFYNLINESAFKASTNYTLSVDIYPSVSTYLDVSIRESNGTNVVCNPAGSQAITANKWNHMIFHLTSVATLPSSTGETIYFTGMSPAVGNSYIFRNLKLEEGIIATPWCPNSSDALATSMGLNGTTEYDTSGFCNNLNKNGTYSYTSDTPKYAVSTVFNGTEWMNGTTPGAEILTLACWAKTTKNKSTSQFMVADSTSGLCISFYSGTIISYFGSSGQSTGSKCTLGSAYKENDWNHFVVVKTGTGTRTVYCNGVEQTATSNDYWGSAAGLFIGSRNNSATLPFYGELSDVRAYATALSADDIKSLYQNSAYIDSSGNVYGAVHSEV